MWHYVVVFFSCVMYDMMYTYLIMKQQIIVIHGADSYATYEDYIRSLEGRTITSLDDMKRKGWKSQLQGELGESCDVILPGMPNKDNARYKEWEIWFEKILALINDDAIFVGHSMGGIFLIKYFSEHHYQKSIKGFFLVASPYEDSEGESLGDFNFKKEYKTLLAVTKNIYLYHSKDDPVVSYAHGEMYAKKIPGSVFRIFENREHFNQETFPEIVKDIRSILL